MAKKRARYAWDDLCKQYGIQASSQMNGFIDLVKHNSEFELAYAPRIPVIECCSCNAFMKKEDHYIDLRKDYDGCDNHFCAYNRGCSCLLGREPGECNMGIDCIKE